MEGLSFEDWSQGFLRIAGLESWPFPRKKWAGKVFPLSIL